jgi:hypothetical protein
VENCCCMKGNMLKIPMVSYDVHRGYTVVILTTFSCLNYRNVEPFLLIKTSCIPRACHLFWYFAEQGSRVQSESVSRGKPIVKAKCEQSQEPVPCTNLEATALPNPAWSSFSTWGFLFSRVVFIVTRGSCFL